MDKTTPKRPTRSATGQVHIWIHEDVAEWVRTKAFEERISRGKLIERILRDQRNREDLSAT